MTTRQRFTAAFKARVALEALRGDKTIQEIATRHKVHPNQVSTWKRQAMDGSGRGIFQWRRQVPCGPRGRDSRSPRQDRSVDGGTGFFGARAQAMSRVERTALIQRDRPGLKFEPSM